MSEARKEYKRNWKKALIDEDLRVGMPRFNKNKGNDLWQQLNEENEKWLKEHKK